MLPLHTIWEGTRVDRERGGRRDPVSMQRRERIRCMFHIALLFLGGRTREKGTYRRRERSGGGPFTEKGLVAPWGLVITRRSIFERLSSSFILQSASVPLFRGQTLHFKPRHFTVLDSSTCRTSATLGKRPRIWSCNQPCKGHPSHSILTQKRPIQKIII